MCSIRNYKVTQECSSQKHLLGCHSHQLMHMCVNLRISRNTHSPFADGRYILGSIDARLLTRAIRNDGTSHGLYTDIHGLFFLPAPIGTKGRVAEVCAFGYPRVEDEEKIQDEMGDLDINTVLRLFLYLILYRPTGKTQTLYTMVYSPIVVYHDLDPGCLSQDDGLNWIVEEGDLLGVLIPGNCTTQLRLNISK